MHKIVRLIHSAQCTPLTPVIYNIVRLPIYCDNMMLTMSTKSLLTKTERKIAKAKIKGKKNQEIGAEVFPNASPQSQRQMVYRELKKPEMAQYIEQTKTIALKEAGVTWGKIVQPFADALLAEKPDGTIDHTTRMVASRNLAGLMEKPQPQESAPHTLKELANTSDEIELQRLIFKTQDKTVDNSPTP